MNKTMLKRRTAKGALRTETLAKTACDLFLERGFDSVTVDDLIARAGGSRRNIYSHFGGKEGLFIEAITKLCEEIAMPLENLNISEETPRDALIKIGGELLNGVLQKKTIEVHRLMVTEGKRFPRLAQAVHKAGHAKAAQILIPWIEKYQKAPINAFRSDISSDVLARQFVALVVMDLQLRFLVGLENESFESKQIDEVVKNAVDIFIRGVERNG
ncbi:putative DNA-binding transcriptional regulator [compost metagenome]